MTKQTTIIEKLRRLVLLAPSSDQAGETLSAIQAINRILKSNGLDIYFLANGIGSKQINGAHERSEPSWHEIACECAEHPEILLNAREHEFVDHMVRAPVRGGQLSEKQTNWLRKIYARIPS